MSNKAKKNLENTCICMLNPIGVSFNKLQIPAFDNKYQTNPFTLKGLKQDTFERTIPVKNNAISNISNISFTSVDDTKVGRAIRELGDVPCPYCGIRVINGKEISHLNKENLGGSGKLAVSMLKPFEDRMHPVEKQVFNLLEDLSKKDPNKNLRQLLDKVRPTHLEIIKQQETHTLNKMGEYSKTFKNKEDAQKVVNLTHEAIDIIDKQDENYIFRRRRFLEKLDEITSKMSEKDKAEGLNKLADELPRAHDNMSAFIVKFTQKDAGSKKEKTPFQIGISLVNPSVGSLEHIKPRHPQDGSEGGKNIYSNYIYASKALNTERKNMPLDKWVEKNPQIKKYMQNYMDAVIDKINNGKALQNCKVYPIIVAKTIENESKGLIKLDTSALKLSKKEISKGLQKIEKEEQEIIAKSKIKSTSKQTKTSKNTKTNQTNKKSLNFTA